MARQAVEASLQTPTSNSETTATSNQPALPTFMDHIQELRGRLFWIAVIFIIAAAASYPFVDVIISFLVAPLKGQELYYLTPVGGFSFLIKICTYSGAVLTMPAVVYHLYRYLQPAVGHVKFRVVLGYVLFSTLLAFSGVAFAYYVSLPAALYFLTGLNISNVTAMLTIDAYYSFVTTYMIGAALLFQVPLLLLIINSITPLKPSKLMGYQRHVILTAFILAAIISPTPDMTNQAILAVPVIIMYQIGILLVWLRNLTKRSKTTKKAPVHNHSEAHSDSFVSSEEDKFAWIDDLFLEQQEPVVLKSSPVATIVQPISTPAPVPKTTLKPSRGYAMDFTANTRRMAPRPLPKVSRQVHQGQPRSFATNVNKVTPVKPTGSPRYIDGVSVPIQGTL